MIAREGPRGHCRAPAMVRAVLLLLSLLAVAAVAASAAPTVGELPETLSWAEFKTAFGRNFSTISTAEEARALEARRQAAFEASVARVREHNAHADVHGFRLGVNQYSDLDDEEFSQLLGNRGGLPLAASASRVADELRHAAPPPASVDWRTKSAVTPVKNQGNCGACWAFSVTGAIEGAYAIATGALRSLSEQQLIDCSTSTGNGGCHGGNQANAFTYAISNKGLDSEKEYTYDGSDDPCWTAAAKRAVATVDSSVAVPPNDEAALAAAVAIAPVAVSIEASAAFRQYKTGVFKGAMTCGNTSASLDHAVLVVGYTADAWIVVRACS
jgi:C1A family cysteine protease